MAAHLRKQIRDAVALNLTGLSTTAANVFRSRGYMLGDEELPALIILAEQESVEAKSIGYPRLQSRDLIISVNAYAKVNLTLDDTLDQICKEVEVALATHNTLGGIAKDLILEQTSIDMDNEGEKPRGVARMYWKATYYVNETTPDVAI